MNILLNGPKPLCRKRVEKVNNNKNVRSKLIIENNKLFMVKKIRACFSLSTIKTAITRQMVEKIKL